MKKIELYTGKHFTGVSGLSFDGVITVISVDEDNDILKVHLKKEDSYWIEDWTLKSTLHSFNLGDYIEYNKDFPYNVWLPYYDYHKAECDIKLKDGNIIYHCYPNARLFNPLCSKTIEPIKEEEVEFIMYRNYYYLDELCKGNCNNEQRSSFDRDNEIYILHNPYRYDTTDDVVLKKNIQPVRTEPKIQRNTLCYCGSGKKYKNCCID